MKYQEALEKIKEMKVSLVNVTGYDSEFLNTIEEAVEKQIPKEVVFNGSKKHAGLYYSCCPRCNTSLGAIMHFKPICSECGQALKLPEGVIPG